MDQDKIILLGIPISCETLEEIAQKVAAILDQRGSHSKPFFLSFVNADFIANVNSWTMYHSYHPELRKILRNTDILSIGDKPLTWLSNLYGYSSKEITGEEILILLAKHLSQGGKSVYLLGGQKEVTELAKQKLEKQFPYLHIVGVSSPFILTKGERLEEALERDLLIVEAINQSKPDVLFIQFGHPKQEIWFQRIRAQLAVPVVVGIGGAFGKFVGTKESTSEWAEEKNVDWLGTLSKLPFKLWARYTVDFLKLLVLIIPNFIYHHLNHLLTKISHVFEKDNLNQFKATNSLFLSEKTAISVIPLPVVIDQDSAHELKKRFQEGADQNVLILDFSKTRHLDLVGLGAIFQLYQETKKNKNLYFFNIHPDTRLLFSMHGIWDCLAINSCRDTSEILQRLRFDDDQLFFAIQQKNNHVTISFFGELTTNHDFEKLLNQLQPILQEKDCQIDLTYCNGIENRGFPFLLRLKEAQKKNGKKLDIIGANSKVKHQFKLVKLQSLLS